MLANLEPLGRPRNRPRHQSPLVAAVFLALSLCVGSSSAQPAGPPEPEAEQARIAAISDADKRVARSLVDAGDEHFSSGSYVDAVESYRGAHALMQVPTTGWELARALEAARRLRESERVLRWVAAYPAWNDQPSAFRDVRARAAEKLEALRARIPSLVVSVSNPDPAMTLTVDGVATGSGTAVPLDPGRHEVELVAPGRERLIRQVELREGASKTLTLTLEGLPSTSVLVPPPPEMPTVPVWSWVGFGVTGIGAIIGGITGGLSLSRASAFKATQLPNGNYPDSERGLRDESLTLAHVSTASLVVGGVGAAVGITGVILTYTATPEEPERTLGLDLGPGGLSLGGSF